MKTEKLLKKMRALELTHFSEQSAFVQISDISALCDMVEGAVPAIDLLQVRLERGEHLAQQDNSWCLFDDEGNGQASGKNLRDLLLNLIWMDC
jgi:hypothetical protein